MFQIDREMPLTIERFSPGDMNAMELIEHICQVHMAIACPDQNGVLHVVSRNLCEKVTRLDLPRSVISCDETMAWQEHASVICVSGEDKDAVAEAEGRPGGTTMSVEGHPMIFSYSMAKAMAKAWAQYFGEPRKVREMKLCWLDPSRPAPWQGLGPLPTVQINDEASAWIVYRIDHSERTGECAMTLVESLPPAYGQDYGAGWD